MVKDRLAELQQARVDESELEAEDVVIPVEYHDTDVVGDDFFAMVTNIQDEISKLRTDIDEVKKKHSAILSAPFPDEKIREELDQLMTSIKKDANRARGKLKGLENKIKEAEQDSGDSTGVLIQRTQHETLTRSLVQVMTDYSIIQANYRDACKNRIRRQLEITGKETTDEEIEEMLEQGNVAIFTQGIIMETQQARQTLADIEARHADIIQLEKSIRELHDMFMEMAMLVENQGEKINSIEFNVERAGNCVNEGKKELVQAVDYQTKARRKTIFIVICIAVVVLVIVLAILLGVFV